MRLNDLDAMFGAALFSTSVKKALLNDPSQELRRVDVLHQYLGEDWRKEILSDQRVEAFLALNAENLQELADKTVRLFSPPGSPERR